MDPVEYSRQEKTRTLAKEMEKRVGIRDTARIGNPLEVGCEER